MQCFLVIMMIMMMNKDYYFRRMVDRHMQIQKQPPEVFCKKRRFRNFANFTGKHLCKSFFLIKLQAWGLRLATFLKKKLWRRCFPMNFVRTPFLQNTSGWLLLPWSYNKPYFQSEPFRSSQRRCSVKKLFSNILQHSQGNICVWASVNKVADLNP